MQTISRPWGKMAFQDLGGKGTPLLLLHGTGCDSGDWNGVIAALSSGQRLIGLDFRGHGESDVPQTAFNLTDLADDALSLLAQLQIEKAVLAGHSLGGMVAMDAASRSDRVSGLVLLEGWTCLGAAESTFGPTHLYGGLGKEKEPATRDKMDRVVAGFVPEIWQRFWASVEEFSASSFLATTALPVCEVYGSLGLLADRMESLGLPPRMRESLIWVEGAGHYLPHERPHEVAAICQNFMRKRKFWQSSSE